MLDVNVRCEKVTLQKVVTEGVVTEGGGARRKMKPREQHISKS